MAVLETIRTKIGWLITILIAVALLSFIVDFNSLESAISSSSDKYTVGKIDGKKISYKDFQEQVEYQTGIAEILGGAASSDEQQTQIRNAAWQHFVDQHLFLKNAAAAGIEVGKDELKDLTVGDNISPVITYDPVLGNRGGKVDVENIRNFVSNIDADASGNSRLYWNYVQNSVLSQQYYAKYGSLFTASAVVNPLVLNNTVSENNVSATVKYVMVPTDYKKDTTVTVSASEIKAYYKAHKEQYKQVASRDIEYALFEVVPSESDLDAARTSLENVYDEFASTASVKNFLVRNSEQQLRNYYYKEGELNATNREINDFVFGKNSKGTSPIIKDDNVYYAAKVVDVKNLPDSVYVRHILIQGDNDLADSLFNVVKKNPAQFSSVAAIYSADKNPNVLVPGDLGWMTQNYMIPGMESVISAKVNQIFTLDTQYGRHIVQVTKATKAIQKKQVAILQKTAVPSKATMNEYYNKANTLATKAAGKLDALQAAAKEQGVYLRPMNVTEATARYSSVDRAKEITRWVFEAKKGAASNVITVNQNFLFVVGVKDTHKEGYSTVAEVSSRIEDVLYNQKKADKTVAEVTAKIEGCATIEDVAKALDQTVTTKENVSFSSLTAQENEPAFLGAVAGAEQGRISSPVKGYMGIYVVEVVSRETGSFYTADDAKAAEAQKNQYLSQMILPAMLESSNSVDNRERFY